MTEVPGKTQLQGTPPWFVSARTILIPPRVPAGWATAATAGHICFQCKSPAQKAKHITGSLILYRQTNLLLASFRYQPIFIPRIVSPLPAFGKPPFPGDLAPGYTKRPRMVQYSYRIT